MAWDRIFGIVYLLLMVSTPNLFVSWSVGKLFVSIRDSGYVNRDDRVDAERNHGTNSNSNL